MDLNTVFCMQEFKISEDIGKESFLIHSLTRANFAWLCEVSLENDDKFLCSGVPSQLVTKKKNCRSENTQIKLVA